MDVQLCCVSLVPGLAADMLAANASASESLCHAQSDHLLPVSSPCSSCIKHKDIAATPVGCFLQLHSLPCLCQSPPAVACYGSTAARLPLSCYVGWLVLAPLIALSLPSMQAHLDHGSVPVLLHVAHDLYGHVALMLAVPALQHAAKGAWQITIASAWHPSGCKTTLQEPRQCVQSRTCQVLTFAHLAEDLVCGRQSLSETARAACSQHKQQLRTSGADIVSKLEDIVAILHTQACQLHACIFMYASSARQCVHLIILSPGRAGPLRRHEAVQICGPWNAWPAYLLDLCRALQHSSSQWTCQEALGGPNLAHCQPGAKLTSGCSQPG